MDRKIQVGMDISQMAHQGGVAIYTNNLSEKLSRIAGLDMVYFYSSFRKPYQGYLKNVKSYKLPPAFFEILFNRWRNVKVEHFIGSVDVFHSSDWTQPPSKAKKVTTYHDVVPLKYPSWSHPKIVDVHRRRLKLVEREVDCVIVVSESTKRDLLEVSKIPEEKITVIYEAPSINVTLQSESKKNKFREKYNLPEKFILAIGGIGKRRNLDRVREACRDYSLVITGGTLPWLSGGDLELLHKSAQVLLYPSLYEGFGLPILDAFAAGLPVITSDVSSMPEIGGEAAMYVDPFDVGDIKKKLDIVVNDQGLREEMIKKGFARVKQFSWEKTATETAKVYQRLYKRS